MLLSVPEEEIFDSIPYYWVEQSIIDYLINSAPYTITLNDDPSDIRPDRTRMDIILKRYSLEFHQLGAFRPGCPFEKKYGHRVNFKDVRDFLSAYPFGVPDFTDKFEPFLISRYGNGQGSRSGSATSSRRSSGGGSARRSSSYSGPSFSMPDIPDGAELAEELLPIVLRTACVIGLVVLFLTGTLAKHWIATIVLAVVALFGNSIVDGLTIPRVVIAIIFLIMLLTGALGRFWYIAIVLFLLFLHFD